MDRLIRAKKFQIKNAISLGQSFNIQGLDIEIESPKGSMRHGDKWIQKMAHDYGYICGTVGADGDEVDVFVGPNPMSKKMFIIEQIDSLGEFDEHKVMLGFDSIMEAREAYFANYPIDWDGFKHIQELFVTDFKDWHGQTNDRKNSRSK